MNYMKTDGESGSDAQDQSRSGTPDVNYRLGQSWEKEQLQFFLPSNPPPH